MPDADSGYVPARHDLALMRVVKPCIMPASAYLYLYPYSQSFMIRPAQIALSDLRLLLYSLILAKISASLKRWYS